jgi:hypothetical protein
MFVDLKPVYINYITEVLKKSLKLQSPTNALLSTEVLKY